ncbi:sensor histidine kinase [Actinacidiphila acidipaludis]|uniref:histidine kinase n=1 Tax=Actinacidiphila acidipaludis TaxID=2873382 RepID=A0ABS7QJ42_9ACTN|nr:HAMP domain-containing sensor histidine kinase [Streptomyces acidipaludis]MBY8882450.1 HAMP domain-containing histidine kinase [Streptomyces acidipaludis]
MARDVPLRRSLLVKLMVLAALVATGSIAATAWLTVHITAVGIRQEQGQALTDDAKAYDLLLGWAATHHEWQGAEGTVRSLAKDTGLRITVTDTRRRVLIDSAGRAAEDSGGSGASGGSAGDRAVPADGERGDTLPAQASATVDPLAVDTALIARTQNAGGPVATDLPSAVPCPQGTRCLPTPAPAPVTEDRSAQASAGPPPTGSGTIDARAVGPFLLPSAERADLRGTALRTAACLRDRLHLDARVLSTPSGRSYVRTALTGLYLPTDCDTGVLAQPTATETRALRRLDDLANACLRREGAGTVRIGVDFGWTATGRRTVAGDAAAASCVDAARRQQLAPYVAPPALLFVSSPRQPAATFLDLSPANRARIAEVTGLVLLVTLAVTALAGTRMVRPLRELAGAARRMTDGDLGVRVKVTANDEMGRVAAAFNSMAERREESEGLRKAMVGDVAHELRNPLSNIRGWLEAAQDGLVVPDRELVTSLLDEAVLLQHVIDDLRDLSAADAGDLRLHTEPLDLAEVVAQVATAHRGIADAAGVTLRTDAPDRVTLTADPVRLRQAVGNLVSNAIRHTPPGGTVTVRAGSPAAGRAVIEVTDTGTGIAPDDLPRVFDRFWRADKSRTRRTGGSGLGLSIVRKLAEAHGGTVTATSAPAQGSTFTLTLPATPP